MSRPGPGFEPRQGYFPKVEPSVARRPSGVLLEVSLYKDYKDLYYKDSKDLYYKGLYNKDLIRSGH